MAFLSIITLVVSKFIYEILIVFFIIMIFYLTDKNKNNFEKMIARKDDRKITYEKQYKEIYELYAKDQEDFTQFYKELDELQKNLSDDIKEIQSNFDSRRLISIENCIIILVVTIVIISLLYFRG